MKRKTAFLFFGIIVWGNVFSQTKNITYDSLRILPYKFVVNKTRFRLSAHGGDDTVHFILFEKYTTKWEEIDSIFDFDDFELKDFNKDGFVDVVFKDNWDNEIYLFNPHKNNYINTGSFSNDDESELGVIDKQLNIFYDWGQYKNWGWTSSLFQIKDYKRIDLAAIENEKKYSEKAKEKITTAIIISKIINNDFENKKQVRKIKWDDGKDFDYASYWKNNWKNFLSKQ